MNSRCFASIHEHPPGIARVAKRSATMTAREVLLNRDMIRMIFEACDYDTRDSRPVLLEICCYNVRKRLATSDRARQYPHHARYFPLLPRAAIPRHALRRQVLRRRLVDRDLLPSCLYGEDANAAALDVLSERRGSRARRFPSVPALPPGARSGQ